MFKNSGYFADYLKSNIYALVRRISFAAPIAAGSCVLFVNCGGGGGSFLNKPPHESPSFVVQSVVPSEGQVWELNRPINITFNSSVDFKSVSPASISIFEENSHAPAKGFFVQSNPRTVSFYPNSPTTTQGAGLSPGNVKYVIQIPGGSTSGITTVQSNSGKPLLGGKTLHFNTSTGINPNDPLDPNLFYDSKVNHAPGVAAASIVTIDSAGGVSEIPFGNSAPVPINRFVGPNVYFTIRFDQPVSPATNNLSKDLIKLQFEEPAGSGTFINIPAQLALLDNSIPHGATVSITPSGPLPPGRKLRIFVEASFRDLRGESTIFGMSVPLAEGTNPIVEQAATPDFDAIVESFNDTSRMDPNPGFVEPAANWAKDGALEAGFSFGGNDTNLDLIVTNNQTLVIDTSSSVLQLVDPFGVPQFAAFADGKIHLRRLVVDASATIIGQGPNPLRFFVSETAQIHGKILLNGIDAPTTLNLGNALISQPGGGGRCGGGDGGIGNITTTMSTLAGGNGNGAFQANSTGGRGGESSLIPFTPGGIPCAEDEDRHPAGGGGGSFATIGESGNDGTKVSFNVGSCIVTQGVSAVLKTTFPRGGAAGPNVFLNSTIVDDFRGSALEIQGSVGTGSSATIIALSTSLVSAPQPTGDIGRYIAFYKSGSTTWEAGTAGCNTSPESLTACPQSRVQVRKILNITGGTFVTVAPALPSIPAAGDTFVVFGAGALVHGELASPAGGQGGGAGGNAILSTNFPNPGFATQDAKGAGGGGGGGVLEIQALGDITISGLIDASGGNGGAGENTIGFNQIGGGSGGGAGGFIQIESASKVVLFQGTKIAQILARGGLRGSGASQGLKDPVLPTTFAGLGHGGRGGKGLIQIHGPSPDKVTFLNDQISNTNFDPNPLILNTTFGSVSRARSIWIDTGASAGAGFPQYQFGGICASGQPSCGLPGEVITDSTGNIDITNPIVASGIVASSNVGANSIVLLKSAVLTIQNAKAAAPGTLAGDRVFVGGNAGKILSVAVSGAQLVLTTDNGTSSNPTLLNSNISANESWKLVETYYHISTIVTNGGFPTAIANFIPPDNAPGGARVQMLFQGADADADGNVNINTIAPTPSTDPFGGADLSQLAGRRFLRFIVTFDIAPTGLLSPNAPRPRVELMKLPMRFH